MGIGIVQQEATPAACGPRPPFRVRWSRSWISSDTVRTASPRP